MDPRMMADLRWLGTGRTNKLCMFVISTMSIVIGLLTMPDVLSTILTGGGFKPEDAKLYSLSTAIMFSIVNGAIISNAISTWSLRSAIYEMANMLKARTDLKEEEVFRQLHEYFGGEAYNYVNGRVPKIVIFSIIIILLQIISFYSFFTLSTQH
jgi:hypothetical protein